MLLFSIKVCYRFYIEIFARVIEIQKMNLKTPILLPLINDYFPKFIKIVIYEGASLIKFKYFTREEIKYYNSRK